MGARDAKIEILFSAAEIARRIEELGREIRDDLGDDALIVAILKGSFVFAADLIRALHHAGMRPQIDFMTLSSYGDRKHSFGTVSLTRDITDDVRGRRVLLLDDILESGRTIAFAKQMLLDRGAEVARIAVLLDKKGKRETPVEADYVGFVCPDKFVVGYGLDYAHYYRELPFIGTVVD